MSGAVLRAAAPGEEKQLRALWREVFHDEDAVIDAFFDCLYAPEDTLVAACGDEIAAAAYLLRGVTLCAAGGREPAAYFYALATRPDCRGRGLGRAITRACVRACAQRGETLCLMPGEESLRRWYEEIAGLKSFGTARETAFTAAGTTAGIEAREIEAAEYAARREALLTGTPHAALPEAFFRFEERLCRLDGGALLALRDADGAEGLACAAREGSRARFDELLWPGDGAAAAAALLQFLGSETCVARLPGEGVSTVMGARAAIGPSFWWGPLFD